MKSNIILIGMSGAGKSTLSVLLAKALGMSFTDTDLLIQQKSGKLLQHIIEKEGIPRFLQLEEEVLCSLSVTHTVIATGGSAVYSLRGMQHLKESGRVIYLSLPYEEVEKRLSNITTRGIVFLHHSTLQEVYEERLPLYEHYADLTFCCKGQDVEDSVSGLIARLDSVQ